MFICLGRVKEGLPAPMLQALERGQKTVAVGARRDPEEFRLETISPSLPLSLSLRRSLRGLPHLPVPFRHPLSLAP